MWSTLPLPSPPTSGLDEIDTGVLQNKNFGSLQCIFDILLLYIPCKREFKCDLSYLKRKYSKQIPFTGDVFEKEYRLQTDRRNTFKESKVG